MSRNSTSAPTNGEQPGTELLRYQDLSVEYRGSDGKKFKAVDGVSFSLLRGETLGLVGESGSGKSTIGSAALGLTTASAGSIMFAGQDIARISARERRQLTARLQIVFQDPYSSLNPLRTIRQTLSEPLLVHTKLKRPQINATIDAMLERVGLDAAAAGRYPSNFSGGQRQRIAIARALMLEPDLIVCDEAVSALDLSVQAQVLNLLMDLQKELDISYLFISHDLSVIRHMCDRIVVLFHGKVMEIGDAETISARSSHPYTRALVEAAPLPHPVAQRAHKEHLKLTLRPARPAANTQHCPFANRCPIATDICESETPDLLPGPTGTLVACHHADEVAGGFAQALQAEAVH